MAQTEKTLLNLAVFFLYQHLILQIIYNVNKEKLFAILRRSNRY